MIGGRQMPHSYERRDIEYRRWAKILKVILLTRFGITVDDSFDEDQLKERFSCGETPSDVTEELKEKRGLVDMDDQ